VEKTNHETRKANRAMAAVAVAGGAVAVAVEGRSQPQHRLPTTKETSNQPERTPISILTGMKNLSSTRMWELSPRRAASDRSEAARAVAIPNPRFIHAVANDNHDTPIELRATGLPATEVVAIELLAIDLAAHAVKPNEKAPAVAMSAMRNFVAVARGAGVAIALHLP